MKRFALVFLAAIALLAPVAHASMVGTDTITWYFPNSTTVFGSDTLAVGSSLSCPGASPLCPGFTEPATFTITGSSISFTESCCTSYASDPFNGYVFSNINFADGGSIGSVTLSDSNMAGLVAGDVSWAGHSITINVQGVSVGSGTSPGMFTLTVAETPEPSNWLLLGGGLLGLGAVRRFKRA
jgi:PEP-CTERM motif